MVIISINMNKRISKIVEKFNNSPFYRGSVKVEEAMSCHTTMKVGGPAKIFLCPEDAESFAYAFLVAEKLKIKTFTLGGGSNLVVSDKGIQGIVISSKENSGLCAEKITDEKDGSLKAKVECRSGCTIKDIVEFCAKKGFSGMENFSGLPGTAGGAAYMNARCYEVNISDRLHSVEYIDLECLFKKAKKVNVEKMSPKIFKEIFNEALKKVDAIDEKDWAYKKSPFMQKKAFITQVNFKLDCLYKDVFKEGCQDAPLEIHKIIQDKNEYFVEERRKRGHFEAPSAGSVFKNNHAFGKPSGALVDQAGLKGLQIGGAQIAPWHGNFIINKGNASAKDIKALVLAAKKKVKQMTGFKLECEIIFVN